MGSELSIDTLSGSITICSMARPLRIEYPGAIYHVVSRGARREAIFRIEADRKLFLDLLGLSCQRTGWQIHAYCLMDNHFHLVVETPRSNLSAGMQWLLGSYTQRSNREHRLWGHLLAAVTKGFWWTVAQEAHICGESATMCI